MFFPILFALAPFPAAFTAETLPMLPDLLHVSRADVQALHLTPAEIQTALCDTFAGLAAGQVRFQPKSQLALAPGHIFQTLMAVSEPAGVAALKWVGMGPGAAEAGLPAVSALICLNDLATGHPLAVMDGEEITLLRTAGLSALAARDLAPKGARVLGLAGAGAQAKSHLEAFAALFPDLTEVICHSRSAASAEALAAVAEGLGLAARVAPDAETLCREADILVSTIPATAGLQPSLDARWLKPEALAVMVDLGRSWRPEGFTAFDGLSTDALAQMRHPIGADGLPLTGVEITGDLESGLAAPGGRQAFCFRGHAAGDLALALLVHQRMRAGGLGTGLSR